MDTFIGNIMIFGFNFAPQGWAQCNGQLLAISQYTALFSLLGTTYGGDGRTTFALPDLRGRTPIGYGQGPGLSNIQLGQVGGIEQVTLITNNLPAHSHVATTNVAVTSANASSEEPAGNIIATQGNNFFAAPAAGNGNMGGVSTTVQNTGANVPFGVREPYLGLNFCIALQGIFPSRN
ncbi:MAG: phage tail protein [Lewinellaceae bacterium]|nr:phage tail protein [Lewinellaceae bacterium]